MTTETTKRLEAPTTISPAPPQTASERVKELSGKVTTLTTTYFDLCQQQDKLSSNQDEEELLKAVIKLQAEELQLSKDLSSLVSKEDISYIQTVSQLKNKNAEKVAKKLNLETTYQANKQLKILREPKLPPQLILSQPRFTTPVVAKPTTPSTGESDILAAEAATFEFRQCIATPNVEHDTKLTFANQMINAIEKIKNNDTPRIQKLKTDKYKLLQTAFVPPISKEIIADFENRLRTEIVPRIAKIDPHCNSLTEYIATKRQEDEIIQEIANLKAQFALAHNLNASNLEFDFLGHKLDTELTRSLETITQPFSLGQEARAQKALNFVDRNYVAREEGGEGDCLTYSLVGSAGLTLDKKLFPNAKPHLVLKENLAAYMRKHRTRFEPLIKKRFEEENSKIQAEISNGSHGRDPLFVFENYLEWTSKPGNWGGNPEIQAMSDLSGQPIVVVQEAFGRRQMNVVQPETGRVAQPLLIKNWGGTHFQSLQPTKTTRILSPVASLLNRS